MKRGPARSAVARLTVAALVVVGCAEDNLVLPEDRAPAEIAAVAGNGQEARAGGWLSDPLVVEVRNADGIPLPQVRVTFAFGEGSGRLEPGETHTDENGRAATDVQLGGGSGTHVIVATVHGEDGELRASFTVRAVGGGEEDEGDGERGGGEGDAGAERPESLSIPGGHLPPPGECRVWHPSHSPGLQPAPEPCGTAIARAPAGTWVLERRRDAPDEIRLHLIHRERAGVVVGRYRYDARTGRYLGPG